jgi:DNA helicase-2/ATP-dependent DNA helicase PcrA
VAVAKFVAVYDHLSVHAADPVEAILGHVLSASGYQQFLADSEDEEDQERLANIEELLTAAREFDEKTLSDAPLETFLEEACLVNETDAWTADDDQVTLMTLHASKGLEFPVVFIVALEEGLLPHERSRENIELLEEERRLLFVGITRAREELHMSLATYREFRGQRRRTVPSQFLMELPRVEMDVIEPSGTFVPADDHDWETHESAEATSWAEDEGDIDFDPAQFDAEPADADDAAPARATRPPLITAPLTTAAELHQVQTAEIPRVPPEAFHQGMVVRHPEYGLGKIVALSGSGDRRTATVTFASSAGEKKFMLAKSPLRPAKGA